MSEQELRQEIIVVIDELGKELVAVRGLIENAEYGLPGERCLVRLGRFQCYRSVHLRNLQESDYAALWSPRYRESGTATLADAPACSGTRRARLRERAG